MNCMKVISLTLLSILYLSSCSTLKPDHIKSLQVPEEGFKLLRHTQVKQDRAENALYLPSRDITSEEFNSEHLHNFIRKLRMAMHNWHGVGIAANQVNKNLQLFLIEADEQSLWNDQLDVVPFQVYINPKITRVSNGKIKFWHGCLSARGEKLGHAATYDWIEYEALNEKGKLIRGRLSGFAAVIFQHEFAHLMGRTYLDIADQYIDTREFYQLLNLQTLQFIEQADDNMPTLIDGYLINETLDEYYLRSGGVSSR